MTRRINYGLKIGYALTLAALVICGSAAAADGKISNTKGPEAPVILGVIIAVEGEVLTVEVPAIEAKKTTERKIAITEKTTLTYLDIADKGKQIPTVGYHIKGHAESDRQFLKSAILSPPIGEPIKLGPERLTMSNDQFFAKVDKDGDGKVSYGEFSVTVENSPKHGPDQFKSADSNKDSFLDLVEFVERMKAVGWWRLSRKSPQKTFSDCDKDGNGKISQKEFTEINLGHIEATFPRYDKDKSGDLDLREVCDYIEKMVGE